VDGGDLDIQPLPPERLPPSKGMEIAGVNQGPVHIEKHTAFLFETSEL
jgi:hypothetical protein